jgi:hypothetical protein
MEQLYYFWFQSVENLIIGEILRPPIENSYFNIKFYLIH